MSYKHPSKQTEIPDTPAFAHAIGDMKRAIDELHAGLYAIDAFEKKFVEELPIPDAVKKAMAYVPFINPGCLVGLSDRDIKSVLLKRGQPASWCDMALDWKKGSIPAIVYVSITQTKKGIDYQLGDGHHRLAYANALGVGFISAIFLRLLK